MEAKDSSLENHPFERLSVSAIVVGGFSAILFNLICTIEPSINNRSHNNPRLDHRNPELIPSLDPQVLREKKTVMIRMMMCYCNEIRTRNDFSVPRFCSQDVVSDGRVVVEEELQLLNKPNHVSTPRRMRISVKKQAMASMKKEMNWRFPRGRRDSSWSIYYDPKPGEFVVGVVDLWFLNKLDVSIVADMLGTMLTKDKCGAEEFLVHGKMEIVKDDVSKARHACGGDRSNDLCRCFREDVEWKENSLTPSEDGSMIKENVPQLKSFRDKMELSSKLTNSRYKPDKARSCKDVLKTG
ncbi:LOW QUALITY PROTEIN: hypothetical protein HID58_048861 [Brassica napus]|uniref:Uncharacterized protein n=1 Tax=Brassica napus TaxID=3708 RepID=A0ABQ8B3N2_BRANA|nr:LOW QUALITY PROTEIN: hypothetical protein HID58_048861 [Brassica napus]